MVVLIRFVFFIEGYAYQTIHKLKSDDNELVIRVDNLKYPSEVVRYNDKNYRVLYSPENIYIREVGFPQLPLMTMLAGVPLDAIPVAEIISEDATVEQDVLLFPFQGKNLEEYEKININEEIYSSDKYFPENILKLNNPGDFHGIRIVQIQLVPFQYNPRKKMLKVYRNVKIKIKFNKTRKIATYRKNVFPYKRFGKFFNELINFEEIFRFVNKSKNGFKPKVSSGDASPWFNPSGTYYKIPVRKEGIYRLDYNYLLNNGINPSLIDPETIRIYNKGKEIPVYVEGEKDGKFDENDFIEFYGDRQRGDTTYFDLYTDDNIYWLIWGDTVGKRIELIDVSPGEGNQADYFIDSIHFEADYDYFKGLTASAIHNTDFVDGETWYWYLVNQNTIKRLAFNTYDVEVAGGTAKIRAKFKGITTVLVSGKNHHLRFYINDVLVGELEFTGTKDVIFEKSFDISLLNDGKNIFSFESVQIGEERSLVYFDWFEIIYPRKYSAKNNKLKFKEPVNNGNTYSIGNFTSDSVVVYNLTENKKLINFLYKKTNGAQEIVFSYKKINNINKDTFFSVGSDKIKIPAEIKKTEFIDLYNKNNRAEYLVITHNDFIDEAKALAEYRDSRLRFSGGIKVVAVSSIYDEFNFGIKNPKAIKDFLKYASENWDYAPAYVVLFGDACWDYKGLKLGNKDYVPSYGYPSSDNWFVCLGGEDDFIPEMLVGRIPVKSKDEAQNYISKLQEYDNRGSEMWEKTFLMINGGKESNEQNLFQSTSRYIRENFLEVPPVNAKVYEINKTSTEPIDYSHKEEIQEIINSGVLVVNSMGHAAPVIYDVDFGSPEELNNKGKYPLMIGMSCNTTKFSEPNITSLSEKFLFSSEKGASSYFGTTGWGMADLDNIIIKEFFRLIAEDSLRCLSEIITKSKLKLLEEAYFSQELVNLINQYTLLGDPALNLALPLKPDLVANDKSIRFSNLYPSEQESPVSVFLKIFNYGLNTADSVSIRLESQKSGENKKTLFSKKISPVGLVDSLSFNWDITGMSGDNILYFSLDTDNKIEEVSENNNKVSREIFIFASEVFPLKPLPFSVISSSTVELEGITSNIVAGENRVYFFEVDTSEDFSSPLFVSDGINEDKFSGKCKINLPFDERYYYWRVRTYDGNRFSKWGKSIFYTDFEGNLEYSWFQKGKGFNNNINNNVSVNNKLILSKRSVKLRVESGGFDDGNLCQILVNNKMVEFTYYDSLVWYAGPGVYVVEVDKNTGKVLKAYKYNAWASPEHTSALVEFINSVPSGNYVLAGIKDTGPRYLVDDFRKAIKTIGSRYADQIGFRDSWAIIGRKGAETGSVPEKLSKRGSGRVSVEDSIQFYNTSGWTESLPVKGSIEWSKLFFDCSNITEKTGIVVNILGKNRNTNNLDTLVITDSPGELNLKFIDPRIYPEIRLRCKLTSDSTLLTPGLDYWGINFIPGPELIPLEKSVYISSDSVLEGERVTLKVKVYNTGYNKCDSVDVKFYAYDNEDNKREIGKVVLININVDSYRTAEIIFDTKGYSGDVLINAEINPDKKYNEFFNLNNVILNNLFVRKDTLSPSIEVLFDGKEILPGDFVSSKPEIVATIYDNSPLGFDDTSQVSVFLNDKKISYSSEKILKLIPYNNGEVRAEVVYRPVLKSGSYRLKIITVDKTHNNSVYEMEFMVEEKPLIKDVFNFPNPFDRETKFTFNLTQPVDDLYIKIYTVNGRLIRTIEAGPSLAGFNTVFWDGTDQDGDRLANGVYFYRVIAKKEGKYITAQNKLVVMR